MRITRTVALLAILCCAVSAHPQPNVLGRAFPLTNTRYGQRGGTPLLTSNGKDFFLVWGRPDGIYISRTTDATSLGKRVLDTNGYAADGVRHDVVWTGTRFLVAATRQGINGSSWIEGRWLDANGTPINAQFFIVTDGRDPRLAFNGTRILMAYKQGKLVMAIRVANDEERPVFLPVAVSSLDTETYSIASDGANFLVAAVRDNVLHTTLVDPQGVANTTQTYKDIGIADTSRGALALVPANGSYLLIHRDLNARIRAMKFNLIGSFTGSGFTDTESTRGSIAVAPSGNGLAIASTNFDQTSVRLLRVDAAGNVTPEVIAPQTTTASLVSVATAGDKVLVAWSDTGGAVHVGSDQHPGTFGSADQTLELMTSSDDGVFVVWSETRDGQKTYRAGVRSPLGDWKETQLPDGAKPIAAAAGGGQFIVVVPRGEMFDYGWFFELGVLRWTAALESIGSEIPIHGLSELDGSASIVAGWVGSAFVIAGTSSVNQSDTAALLLSPSGALSAPKLIYDHRAFPSNSYTFPAASFAFHANTFVVFWKAAQWGACFPGSCDALFNYRARALRVSADLSVAEPFEIAPYTRNVESIGGVAWDGSAFVVAWKDERSLYTRRVPETGALEAEASVTAQEATRVSLADGGAIAAVPGGVALLWRLNGDPRQSIVRSGVAAPAEALIDFAPQRIASSGNAIAYAYAIPQNAAPHYGATRVMMNIGDVALAQVPEPPRLSATLTSDGRTAVLTWVSPPRELNGYRIEQRGSDGEWLEVDRWLSAGDARIASIPVSGATSFRIRAWNNAGVSTYSNVLSPAPPQRRSIRH
jgi:hypothetical protein